MEDEVIESAIIDPGYDSYKQFFDHDWCKAMFNAVECSPLKAAVQTLLVAWRSTNGAHRLPWLMVHSLKSFADGGIKGQFQFRNSYSEEFINGIVDNIEAAMQPTLGFEQRAILHRVITRLEGEAFERIKAAKSQVVFDVRRYWDLLVQASEFRFSILGTQSLNYGALFFAYEDFLANAIRTKDADYTSKETRIQVAFAQHFGESLRDYCWPNDNAVDEIDLSRRIRHTFAHNGGRYRANLDKYKSRFDHATGTNGIKLQGERFVVSKKGSKIQIMPRNTAYLFGVLKDRISKIVEELA